MLRKSVASARFIAPHWKPVSPSFPFIRNSNQWLNILLQDSLTEIEVGSPRKTSCGHFFCSRCLFQLLKTSSVCPVNICTLSLNIFLLNIALVSLKFINLFPVLYTALPHKPWRHYRLLKRSLGRGEDSGAFHIYVWVCVTVCVFWSGCVIRLTRLKLTHTDRGSGTDWSVAKGRGTTSALLGLHTILFATVYLYAIY